MNKVFGTGWLPPTPDSRDYTPNHDKVKPLLKSIRFSSTLMPKKVDLRKWCSPVKDQGTIGSCTAHAVLAIVEYFQNRAHNKHINGSRLFLYKTTRNLIQIKGDDGAELRNAMGALTLCGVPDERFWPYTDSAKFDEEPSAFAYAVADNYKAITYFCHDSLANTSKSEVLKSVKEKLAEGIPSVFGFWGFGSIESIGLDTGFIPFPGSVTGAGRWGHAVATFGYDDDKEITNKDTNQTTKGALLFKNSWGKEWGDGGYGWLPYAYVEHALAIDFWSLISAGWIETGQFGLVDNTSVENVRGQFGVSKSNAVDSQDNKILLGIHEVNHELHKLLSKLESGEKT